MKRTFQIRFSWIFTLVVIVLLAIPFTAFADDISNNLDISVDAVAEVMPLVLGGPNGSTQLYVVPRNGDGKSGCNLTGGTSLVVSVSSSNPAAATVSPSSVTFTSCGDTPTLTVTPVGVGSTTISAAQVSNNTGGTFNLAPATFTVNVALPPNTPPSVSVTGVTGGAGYEIGAVPTAVCSVVDAEDGNSTFPATLSAISGPLAAYGLGEQAASCSYTDGGGLTAIAAETYGIVDTIAPVITFISRTPANGIGWNNGDVTVNWSCTDSGSGAVVASVSQTVSTEGANQSAIGSCEDHAGNTASDTQSGINIDKTAPTASASATVGGNAYSGVWTNQDVVVSFSGTDAGGSGFAGCSAAVTVNSEGANQTSPTGTCTDNAGNVSAPVAFSPINIDKTAPSVSVTGVTNGAIYTLGSVPAAGCSTTDALSGVATNATLTVSGGLVGSITVTCNGAKDNADNSGSASATYSVNYAWTGFFQPVDNLPTLNQVKAGSAIPVKFSLGGNQGLAILAAGSPGSVAVGCDTSAPIDTIVDTVTAGNSSLNYDASTNQYIYVWKTDKAWAGQCRQLVMRLIDGTEHKANFKLTK